MEDLVEFVFFLLYGLDWTVQVKDLECEGKEGVSLDELRWIHRHKTGALLKVRIASHS